MGSLSNYSENALLGHLFTSAYTAPSNIYLALLTADPTSGDGASITEAANANGYARTAISFGAASARRVTQDALLTFPAASGSWGTITHWALVDSATYGAGNVLAHGAFSSSFSPVAGNTPKVAAGQVYVEISASSGAGFTTATVNSLLDLMFNGTAFSSPAGNTYKIQDDAWALDFYFAHKDDTAAELVHAVLTNTQMWDQDLTRIEGLEAAVLADLELIRTQGAEAAYKSCL